jgi:hypothetical protein
MEIKLYATESYTTYVIKDSITIESDNYPELSGMNEEEILEYINLNGSSMKPTDDEYYSDLMNELMSMDVISEKICGEDRDICSE